MGKGKTPTYNPPKPPTLPTAEQLYSSATQNAQMNFPEAYGAREGALKDIASGNDYYNKFQPTSFEDALANQYYANVWPDTQKTIMHALSLSGLDSSPVLADQLGRAQGQLRTDIGTQLLNLGNQRATNSLNARLGIDPMASLLGPYVQTGMNQGNTQANLNYNYAQQLAQAQYQQAMNNYQNKQGFANTLSNLGGMGLGALLALPTGGLSLAAGAALGGLGGSLAAPIFGGSAPSPEALSGDMLGFMLGGGGDWLSGLGQKAQSINPSTVAAFGGGVKPYNVDFGQSLYGVNYKPLFSMN